MLQRGEVVVCSRVVARVGRILRSSEVGAREMTRLPVLYLG